MVGIATVPLALGVLLSYLYAREAMRGQVFRHMESVAESKATYVERLVAERVHDATVFAEGRALRDGILSLVPARAAHGEAGEEAQQIVTAGLRTFLDDYTDYLSASVTDVATGDQLFCVGTDMPGDCESHVGSPDVAESQAASGRWISPAHRHDDGRPTVALVVPIRHPEPAAGRTEPLAQLVLHLDLARSIHPFLNDLTGMGTTGEVVLVDGSGLALKDLRYEPNTALARKITALPALRAAGGETGVVEVDDYRPKPVLAAYRHLRTLGWGLVAKTDASEAYAPIRQLAILLASVGIAVAALTAGLAHWLAGRTARPIAQLSAAARAMANGDLTARVQTGGSDDIARLARDFNAMGDQLSRIYGELEERVRDRTAQLERSNTDLEMFAFVASHDLREPLRIVTMSVQLLARRYDEELDEDAKKWIGRAVDGAARMATLIADILAFSRVGAADAAFEPTDLEAVLDQTLRYLEPAMAESDAIIARAPLPTVTCDASQFEQILQNLIGNAIKFRSEAAPRMEVAARRESAEWVFSVSDNGIGIAPEHADDIFDAFHRLHSKDEHPGTGIGLATCRRIVERHGGRIWVESRPEEGSVFYFTIPDGAPGATPAKGADHAC